MRPAKEQALPASDIDGMAARTAFRVLTERLWMPNRIALLWQVAFDPERNGDQFDVSFATGLIGGHEADGDEVQSIAQVVEAQLRSQEVPFGIEQCDPARVLELPWMTSGVNTVLVRQRFEYLDDPEREPVPVLVRFSPCVDPWTSVCHTIASLRRRLVVRISLLPTLINIADRRELDDALRAVHRIRARSADNPELGARAERAHATLVDVVNSFGSPVFCGELTIIADRVVAEPVARAIALSFTSELDLVRNLGHVHVATRPVLVGGFGLEHDPEDHLEALRFGLPLRGGVRRRDMRDLWTFAEAATTWPMTNQISHEEPAASHGSQSGITMT